MAEDFGRENSLGYLINLAGRLMARALYRRLLAYDVAFGAFPLLLILWEEDGLTQSELARRLDLEQPTVANTLKRMQRDGLVTAAPDPAHARRVLFRLSPHARDLEKPLKQEAMAVNGVARSRLSEAEVGQLRTTLAKAIAALREDV